MINSVKKQWISLLLIALLQMIRIIFFSVDTHQTLMDAFLIWTIFSLSFLWLVWFILTKRMTIDAVFKKHRDLLVVSIFVIIVELSFMIKVGIPFTRIYLFAVPMSLSIWLGFTLFFKGKTRRIINYVFMIIYAIYIIGQDIYYRIFNDFFSFKEVVTLREGIESGETAMRFNVYYIFVGLMLLVALYLYRKQPTDSNRLKKYDLKYIFILPVLLFALITINTHFPKDRYRVFSSEYYLMQQIYHKETFVGTFGSLTLAIRDIIDSISPNFGTSLDVKWITQYYESQDKQLIDHNLKGVFEGKNLIIIMAESFDEIALSSELTPNIYKLKTEGIDFQNHYTPVFPRTTSDMEFIINVGLIPSIEDGPTVAMYKNNSYRISLANLFNEKNYHTSAFHGNYKEFYNRDVIYKNYGYDFYFGQDELNLNDINKKLDTDFYIASKNIIFSQVNPFYSLLITFSGHSPYNHHNPSGVKHYDSVHQIYGNTLPETLKYYIASMMEIDEMLGMLLHDLDANNQLDDTVILFTGDHYPYTMLASEYEMLSTARTLHEKQKGNLYIWSNQITPRKVETLSSSFDILPTIAHMFNLDFNINHYVGNDVFSNPNTVVYFKDYVIYDGTRFIKLSSRYESDSLFLEKGYDAYLLSRKVLRTNYFKI